ncbi:MAG TPA: rRNA adenine N-6-methyltransferase family protein [Saprospiraceae bacterium]|nr:rRNA adenine N-6-methyltransferase family protein [Saprospiraceae bacterium]
MEEIMHQDAPQPTLKMHRRNVWKERALFLLNFIKNPIRNASITPSSKIASSAMMKGIDWEKVNTIVELGPGSGTFTKEILARAKPGTQIILFELETTYVDLLRKKFGNRVHVIHASAHLFEEILKEMKLPKADLIISGLPFLARHLNQLIFDSIQHQTDKGAIFRFFTYMPPLMKLVYKGINLRKVAFVFKNIPPMWVYGIN